MGVFVWGDHNSFRHVSFSSEEVWRDMESTHFPFGRTAAACCTHKLEAILLIQ